MLATMLQYVVAFQSLTPSHNAEHIPSRLVNLSDTHWLFQPAPSPFLVDKTTPPGRLGSSGDLTSFNGI